MVINLEENCTRKTITHIILKWEDEYVHTLKILVQVNIDFSEDKQKMFSDLYFLSAVMESPNVRILQNTRNTGE